MNKNRWKSNIGWKIGLTVVSFVMAAAVFLSGAAVIVIGAMDAYSSRSKEETLEKHYERCSDIYTVMAMANRKSPLMQEELDRTNFRYGIIRDEAPGAEEITDISELKRISDPASYEYYNFETMPVENAIENGEVRVQEFEIGEGTRYSWDCRLFGYANVYEETEPWEEVVYEGRDVPITGYYYNVLDGIFYYETEEEFYRVDEVGLFVGDGDISDMKLRFKYDSGQGAYYNLDREECAVKDYYLTFNKFDDYAGRSWETWNTITLDGVELSHTDIRFVNGENTERGELLGKPISDHYYSYSDGSGALSVRMSEDEVVKIKKKEPVRYWVISEVRDPLVKTGIHDSFLEGDLFEQAVYVTDLAYTWRYPAVAALVISIILWIASTVLVLVMAGHKGSYENTHPQGGDVPEEGMEADTERIWVDAIKPGFWQKIPLDVETVLIAGVGCVILVIAVEMTYYGLNPWNITIAALCCAGCYLISLIWLVDFVVRVKLGKWWRGTLTYRILVWIWKKCKSVLRYIWKGFQFLQENLSLLWKAILILGGISLLECFGIAVTSFSPGAEMCIWFLYRGATLVLILVGIVQANQLKEGAKKLADGNLQEKIDTEKMFWEFKKHGEALNSIHDGISVAVEKRMQSEHFRTELITNVSHDIKTPLTSIINYVDLLQKEEIHNEKAKEYLEVLNRQSARLKKLTEDLIEASKASTGSMPVKMESLELGVFLTQTVGEFEEKIHAAGLHVVMHKPESEVFVRADGRHLWRVVENLVQNICKYAQPGTRVYIDLDETEKEAMISFKNISQYELNISGSELMERFVRGDASRHTDGSGLGLSIAGSLMELMNGKLEIVVDGDLFKVVLHFPR